MTVGIGRLSWVRSVCLAFGSKVKKKEEEKVVRGGCCETMSRWQMCSLRNDRSIGSPSNSYAFLMYKGKPDERVSAL